MNMKALRRKLLEWVSASVIAAPIVGLYVASKELGGWVWQILFILAIGLVIGIGYWSLYKAYEEDD